MQRYLADELLLFWWAKLVRKTYIVGGGLAIEFWVEVFIFIVAVASAGIVCGFVLVVVIGCC